MKKFLCVLLACLACSAIVFNLSGCKKGKNDPGYTIEPTEPDIVENGFSYYIINSNELMVTQYSGDSKNVQIPESYNSYSITSIGPNAFSDSDIETITMSDSIKEIQSYAFASCKELRSVTLSKNLKSFGTSVFFLCTSLENIEIPNTVEDLGIYTFQGSAVKSVKIPDGNLKEIKDFVFYQCPSLVEVSFPATVTTIADSALSDNKNQITIKAPTGSSAEKYAETFGSEYNLVFEAVE